MSRPPPRWHSEAKALRASGVDPRVIATRMDQSITMIRWVLDEHGERAATLARVHEARLRERRHARRATDKTEQHGVEPARKSAPIAIARETIDQAVRDFAERKIDRETLMARITPGVRA